MLTSRQQQPLQLQLQLQRWIRHLLSSHHRRRVVVTGRTTCAVAVPDGSRLHSCSNHTPVALRYNNNNNNNIPPFQERRVSLSSSSSVFRLGRPPVVVAVRYQSSSATWTTSGTAARSTADRMTTTSNYVSPPRRKTIPPPYSITRNGQPILLHIKDLQQAPKTTIHQSPRISSSTSSYNSTTGGTTSDATSSDSKKLIVMLDLDECLVHSRFFASSLDAAVYTHQLLFQKHSRREQQQLLQRPPGNIVPYYATPSTNTTTTSTSRRTAALESFRIVIRDRNQLPAHVWIRPGLIHFLRECTAHYETHIFTAAEAVYADPILDHLSALVRQSQNNAVVMESSNQGDDHHQKSSSSSSSIFRGRWYRQHCTYDPVKVAYAKDLSTLNHPHIRSNLHKTVLVDNNPLSFLTNPENGILVESFYDNPSFMPEHYNDRETFPNLLNMLHQLDTVSDVRPILAPRMAAIVAAAAAAATKAKKTTTTPLSLSMVSNPTIATTRPVISPPHYDDYHHHHPRTTPLSYRIRSKQQW
jgi:hypothetical protein